MGLVGILTTAMAFGNELVLGAPQDFMASPSRWVQWLSDYRGSLTAAPNFAYVLAARAMERLEGLDLSPLRLAINGLLRDGKLAADPLTQKVAAVSCGIYKGTPVLDLDYDEDSAADADANFVLLENGHIAEAQATAEGATYDEEGLLRLLRLARIGCSDIFAAQAKAVAP